MTKISSQKVRQMKVTVDTELDPFIPPERLALFDDSGVPIDVLAGTIGPQGPQGVQGVEGLPGPAGVPGIQGPAGGTMGSVVAKALRLADFTTGTTFPANTTLVWDTIDYDPLGIVNLANGVFTIPEDGQYIASAQWYPGASAYAGATTVLDAIIWLNPGPGSPTNQQRVADDRRFAGGNPVAFTLSGQFKAYAGDMVLFQTGRSTGAAASGAGSINVPNYMSLSRVGGPKGDPGAQGIPGGIETGWTMNGGSVSSGGSTAASAWVITPFPTGWLKTGDVNAFTRNADGSLTVRDAGLYSCTFNMNWAAIGTPGARRLVRLVTGVNEGDGIVALDERGAAGSNTSIVTYTGWIPAGCKFTIYTMAVTDANVSRSVYAAGIVRMGSGPQGDTGPTGATGATGAPGANGTNGAGVVSGGATGQVLSKKSATNYDTEWTTPPKFNGGNSQCFFPGASQTSTPLVVNHGLGVTPRAIIATGLGNSHVAWISGGAGAISFTLNVATRDESTPANGANVYVYWMAMV